MTRPKLNKQKKTLSLRPETNKKLEFWSLKNNKTHSEAVDIAVEMLVGKYL